LFGNKNPTSFGWMAIGWHMECCSWYYESSEQ
jgi:hypothetical protein